MSFGERGPESVWRRQGKSQSRWSPRVVLESKEKVSIGKVVRCESVEGILFREDMLLLWLGCEGEAKGQVVWREARAKSAGALVVLTQSDLKNLVEAYNSEMTS